MAEDTTKRMGNVIRIDEGEIRGLRGALGMTAVGSYLACNMCYVIVADARS